MGSIEFNLDGIILTIDMDLAKRLGYTEAELKGNPFSLILDRKVYKSDHFVSVWSKLRNGGSYAGEFKFSAKDGSELVLNGFFANSRKRKF